MAREILPDRTLLADAAEAMQNLAHPALDSDVTTVLPVLRASDTAAEKHEDEKADLQPAAVSAHPIARAGAPAPDARASVMPRVNAIWNHELFQRHFRALNDFERDRPFCRHGLPHLLDVARLAWIENLEEHLGFDCELVYATALLHDVGKAEQYATGTPHELAGEKIASGILATLPDDASFTTVQARQILTAIRGHRHLRPDATPLERLIYHADKRSRTCFACSAADRCKWAPERRVTEISW